MRLNISDAINDLNIKKSIVDKLNINELAKQLASIGFKCKKCGECCRARSGDNTVVLFPDEIQLIMDICGMDQDDVCEPSIPQFIDKRGVLHCFEWMMKRHGNGDCRFIQADNTCTLYQQRPWICSTYPFFLSFTDRTTKPEIIVSECKGIGQPINDEDAILLVKLLKGRLLAEITEEIGLLEKLEGFDDWVLIKGHSIGGYPISVHDSWGITFIID